MLAALDQTAWDTDTGRAELYARQSRQLHRGLCPLSRTALDLWCKLFHRDAGEIPPMLKVQMLIIKQQLPELAQCNGLCHLTTMPSHSMLSRKPGMTVRMMMKTSSAAASFTVCAALDPFGKPEPLQATGYQPTPPLPSFSFSTLYIGKLYHTESLQQLW